MGALFYDDHEEPILIDDTTLAHLKVVIATKLRRNESFTVSWKHGDDDPSGRSTIWLHPAIPLRFVFDDPVAPPLNPEFITSLANAANSSGGLTVPAGDVISSGLPSGAAGGRSENTRPQAAKADAVPEAASGDTAAGSARS
ncbi:DUF7882 family protein [Microbacterium sp. XT11]|uniref:DUF7882 family protein n=1 Tax=Microbacterium sp. XT11 TaxID=367477 RepID=UPI00074302EF|nr:hypothetical protein AB663_000256 [Microbacterium sp. XT11]